MIRVCWSAIALLHRVNAVVIHNVLAGANRGKYRAFQAFADAQLADQGAHGGHVIEMVLPVAVM